jgi:4-hydroxybenzoyl-CoA thioesterase
VLSGNRIGRTTFDFTIETTCEGARRMSYAATLIFIDAHGKSTPWTDNLRAALTSYISNEA